MLLPLAYLVLRTLSAGPDVWELVLRPRTLAVLLRTGLLVVTVTTATIALAVPLAWLIARTDLPGRRVWATLTILPLVIPSYVGGFLIVAALGPRGLLQQGLAGPLGVERLPEIYGFPGAMITLTLLSYPYVLLPVRAALEGLDPALEEASRGLGKTAWETFRGVSLPLLRPAIASGALLVALYTLRDFGAVSLFRYETFTWAIYAQYEGAFDRTLAAALSLVLTVLALGILIAEARGRGPGRGYSSATGTRRPPARLPLGRWRWGAFAFCGLVVLLALGVPLALLLYWVIGGMAAGEPLLPAWSAAQASVAVSGLAAGAAVVAALPVAFLAVRHPGPVTTLIERAPYLGFALPGIVVALALVLFAVATPLYQSLTVLLLGYLVLFLAPAVGSLRASLLQVRPSLEEAARGLGRGPWSVLATVTVPLVRPGALAGGALVFLLAMKELPATLILSPIGFETLATSIWSAASEAMFVQAAMPALLLVAAAGVPMALLTVRGWGELQ